MLAGLAAGAIAAIIASLVSLPLHSPVDAAFNSATVAVAALLVGLISGLLWTWLSARMLWYGIALAGLFIIVLVVALAGNSQLDRLASFSIPLAAIVIIVCAVLTPALALFFFRPNLGLMKWLPAIAVILALAVGFGLITQGDAESGDLALPPLPPTAAAPVAPAPTETAAAPTAPPNTPMPMPTAPPPPAATEPAPATAPPPATPAQTAAPPATATSVPAEPTPIPAPTDAAPEAGEPGQAFVIGDGSEITFTVEEELRGTPVRFDAVIAGTALSGTANLDGQPSVVTLDLHSLESDQRFRDRYIQSRMFPDTPEAVVTVEALPDLPQSFFDGETTTGELAGSLQIGDAVTPLVFEVEARHDGDTINVLGRTTFTWEELGLVKPTAPSVTYLADEVRVQVLLIARAR